MRLELETRRFYLGRDYSEAVFGCGGIPLHIPLIPDEELLSSIVGRLDGVLLPGSDSDVDPNLYGDDPHPRLGRVVPEKDETDQIVIRLAEARSIPIFGICYGMQAINVYRGGTLIQDIQSQVPDAIKHEQGQPLARNSHRISIDPDTRLAGFADGESAMVNSHHHQAVDIVGRGLRATARTADGVVECIEDAGADFLIGVQWHPELSWETDTLSKKLFEEFVEVCRARVGSANALTT